MSALETWLANRAHTARCSTLSSGAFVHGAFCDCGCHLEAEPTHWIGDAPTSLHSNGGASFARTTRDTSEVTCVLCRTLLARDSHDSGEGHGTREG